MSLWTRTPDFRRATPAPFIGMTADDAVPPRPRRKLRPILWAMFAVVAAAVVLSLRWWHVASAGLAQAAAAPDAVIAHAPTPGAAAVALPADSDALSRGAEALRRGALGEADTLLTSAVRANPEDASAHIYLGQLALQERDAATALIELRTAVRLAPTNALAHRLLGEALLVGGSDESARRELTTSLLQDPLDARTAGFLGCALARTGQTRESRRMLERAGRGPWMECVASPVRKSPMPPGR